MAKTRSKSNTKSSESSKAAPTITDQAKGAKNAKKTRKTPRFLRKIGRSVKKATVKYKERRAAHPPLHRSFKRSYREDYHRPLQTPGLLSHAMTTFQIIFRHWRTFLPFLALISILYILFVGLFSENLYQQFQDTIDTTSTELAQGQIGNFAKAGLLLISTVTSGGLNNNMSESETIFMVFFLLIIWLVTIFLLRHFFAGEKPKLRDGLYNALAPLVSTLVVFAVIFVQLIPIMLVIITYSAAISTDFLSTPFYALVYFIFAALMILLSGYLLSSSILALIAVTAPGVYPMVALSSSAELIAGRRTKFIIRIIYLIIVISLVYVIIMMPVILLDLWFKSMWSWLEGWPIVPFCLLLVTCFSGIYITTYLYRYYRWLLDYREE